MAAKRQSFRIGVHDRRLSGRHRWAAWAPSYGTQAAGWELRAAHNSGMRQLTIRWSRSGRRPPTRFEGRSCLQTCCWAHPAGQPRLSGRRSTLRVKRVRLRPPPRPSAGTEDRALELRAICLARACVAGGQLARPSSKHDRRKRSRTAELRPADQTDYTPATTTMSVTATR